MALISFDDGVNSDNLRLFSEMFDNRRNPNGCPISTTYFVSSGETNFHSVRTLSQKGVCLSYAFYIILFNVFNTSHFQPREKILPINIGFFLNKFSMT